MKKKIGVFHQKYLPLSETFIYRQLCGLSDYFDVKLITKSVENREQYPGIVPSVVPVRRAWSDLLKIEPRFFEKHLKGCNLLHVNFGTTAVAMQDVASRLDLPMSAFFLGIDASAALLNADYCKRLRESRFRAVFVNSQDMKKRLEQYLPQGMNCYVSYCGIPLENFPFKQRYAVPEGALFLQLSRLTEKKGIAYTLQAFKRYTAEIDPTAKLLIGGDGPLRQSLMALSHSLGLGENVTFLGSVRYSDYLELMQSADVFIHPSITADDGDMEGIPTVICEAMACGMPVLATRHSGIPELVEDGIDGYLVEERDIAGLFERMVLLRKSSVADISGNARKKVELRFNHLETIHVLANHMKELAA